MQLECECQVSRCSISNNSGVVSDCCGEEGAGEERFTHQSAFLTLANDQKLLAVVETMKSWVQVPFKRILGSSISMWEVEPLLTACRGIRDKCINLYLIVGLSRESEKKLLNVTRQWKTFSSR